jgi:signal transduction histidine kinase
MAETAVDLLHNIGNVLNSVGITTQDLMRKVRQSKMASMQPLIDLMEDQGDKLPDFIANDPRGRKLPAYLSGLSAHLHEDHRAITAGLNDLERHIGHLQDIVRLQQSYSRTIGLTERVDVVEVIEDAIALNKVVVQRYGIRIEKDLAPMPKVILDRQKLLQILTNLISNAKQALHNENVAHKRIHIKMDCPQPKLFHIAVSDNGLGIAQENLTRIFQHGFTTRPDGHGFGLHSSAIAAFEMDGTLQAESPGPGCGATFTIELPVRTVENEHELA